MLDRNRSQNLTWELLIYETQFVLVILRCVESKSKKVENKFTRNFLHERRFRIHIFSNTKVLQILMHFKDFGFKLYLQCIEKLSFVVYYCK